MIDSALVRLRPVLVTVLATVGGLIPLALEGGPLWEPMCYVQIVGLLAATLVTKVVVPVLYVMFVEDLKIIRWDNRNWPGLRATSRRRVSRRDIRSAVMPFTGYWPCHFGDQGRTVPRSEDGQVSQAANICHDRRTNDRPGTARTIHRKTRCSGHGACETLDSSDTLFGVVVATMSPDELRKCRSYPSLLTTTGIRG